MLGRDLFNFLARLGTLVVVGAFLIAAFLGCAYYMVGK